jgi:transposase InsO family protein
MGLHPDSREATAFTVPGLGRFHWKRMPMGCKGANASFQRLMELILRGQERHAQAYVDDVLFHSSSTGDHLRHLEEGFKAFRNHGIKLSIDKSKFCTPEIRYLGHVLSKDGVRPCEDHVKAVRDYPEPTTPKKILEFTGLCNYFRDHIHRHSTISGQLTRLLRKDSDWKEGPLPEKAKTAFLDLKTKLCSAPVLAYPRQGLGYIVAVDAATGSEEEDGGLGAILSQVQDGKEVVIAYASRSLRGFEKNYTPGLLELAAASWSIEHWHHYLYGRKFTLLTDHLPIEGLSRIHTKTLNRLKQQMLEYDFRVGYRKGADNAGPDALSRNPVDALEVTSSDMVELQSQDSLIESVRRFMKTGELPREKEEARRVERYAEGSFFESNVLYYLLQRKGAEPARALWTPTVIRKKLIHGRHAGRFAGHGGMEKTLQRLQEEYYWPGMVSDVQEFVTNCVTCRRAKNPSKQVNRFPLQPLELLDRPNVRCHIDLVGPLKTSGGNKRWIMCITDAFTKYAVAVALPDKQAATVAKAFYERWICWRGPPEQLVSDRGLEFCNQILDTLCNRFEIERRKTAAYHPASNSAVESFNRKLISYITTQCNDNTLEFEDWLAPMCFSYNTCTHKSTLHSPFYLTYLHPPRLPFGDLDDLPRQPMNWAEEAFQRMQRAYRLAKENNVEASRKSKEHYDLRAKEKQFSVGNQVLVHFHKAIQTKGNPKFATPWKDGFVITRKIGEATYQVKKAQTGRTSTVHADRLKLRSPNAVNTTPLRQQQRERGVQLQDVRQAEEDEQADEAGDEQHDDADVWDQSDDSAPETEIEIEHAEPAARDQDVEQPFIPRERRAQQAAARQPSPRPQERPMDRLARDVFQPVARRQRGEKVDYRALAGVRPHTRKK